MGRRTGKPYMSGNGPGQQWLIYKPESLNAYERGNVAVSRDMGAHALGRKLLTTEVVSFINGDINDIRAGNLVICSRKSAIFYRVRMRALVACGNPDWRKCEYCKTYDDPHHLDTRYQKGKDQTHFFHKSCRSEYHRRRGR